MLYDYLKEPNEHEIEKSGWNEFIIQKLENKKALIVIVSKYSIINYKYNHLIFQFLQKYLTQLSLIEVKAILI
jgi:hypothetical protein